MTTRGWAAIFTSLAVCVVERGEHEDEATDYTTTQDENSASDID